MASKSNYGEKIRKASHLITDPPPCPPPATHTVKTFTQEGRTQYTKPSRKWIHWPAASEPHAFPCHVRASPPRTVCHCVCCVLVIKKKHKKTSRIPFDKHTRGIPKKKKTLCFETIC